MGFVRVDSDALRLAANDLEERELRVWLILVARASAVNGTCYEGIAKIAKVTGYRVEAVTHALDALASAGYIGFVRRGERDPLTGQMIPNVYCVNGVLIDGERPIPLLNLKTESNTTITQIDNTNIQHDQGTPPPNTNAPSNAEGENQNVFPPPHENKRAENQNAKRQNQREAQAPETPSANAEDPPRSAPPPQQAAARRASYYRGSLAAWKDPLDDAGELAAARLRGASNNKMAIRNARRLVSEHGLANVDAALMQLSLQDDVDKPAGYLCWLLDGNGVDFVHDGKRPAPAADDGKAYISGKYSDLIDH